MANEQLGQLPLDRQAPPSTMNVDPTAVWVAQQARTGATMPAATSPTGSAGDPESELFAQSGAITKESRAAMAERLQASQAAGGRETGLESQYQQEIQDRPKVGPMVERGAGFLHNLGQVLAMIGASTVPGSRIEQQVYGPALSEWQARHETTAKGIEAAREQEKVAGETAGAMGQAGVKSVMGGARVEMAGAAKQKAQAAEEMAQARMADVNSQINNRVGLLQQKWATLSKEQKRNAIMEERNRVMMDVAKIHADAYESVGLAMSDAMTNRAAATEADEIINKHPILGKFAQEVGVLPSITVPTTTPGARTGTGTTKPGAAAPTKGGHNFTYNGKTYSGVPDALYNKYKGKPGFKE